MENAARRRNALAAAARAIHSSEIGPWRELASRLQFARRRTTTLRGRVPPRTF
jgi:hypothetical protein